MNLKDWLQLAISRFARVFIYQKDSPHAVSWSLGKEVVGRECSDNNHCFMSAVFCDFVSLRNGSRLRVNIFNSISPTETNRTSEHDSCPIKILTMYTQAIHTIANKNFTKLYSLHNLTLIFQQRRKSIYSRFFRNVIQNLECGGCRWLPYVPSFPSINYTARKATHTKPCFNSKGWCAAVGLGRMRIESCEITEFCP
jgi:hypothetical protein